MLVILGAKGGLGKGLTEYFKSSVEFQSFGAVVAASRDDVDVEIEESVADFFKSLAIQLQPTESIFIINAVGVSLNGFSHKIDLKQFEKTLAVNLTGSFLLLKYAQPLFKNHPGSSMVLLSSVVAELGVPGTIAYAASKAGLRGLVRTGSKELARLKATLNAIELGYFEAGMIKQVPAEQLGAIIEQIPLNRLGSIEDLARACHFSLRTGFFTGSIIKLNGGML